MHFINRPAAAVWTIAPKMGIDLSAAIKTEALTPQGLSDMLSNCALCWHSRKCARWERELSGKDAATEAPTFCASRERLNALAASVKADPAP
ncbi:DUF6455 family protein [Pararhodobacter sp.]|uniref:DUF6455 family protein n=1 Tax=Pararhodobacter sp. TaxID=2127056 RepID=UPI002FDF2D63